MTNTPKNETQFSDVGVLKSLRGACAAVVFGIAGAGFVATPAAAEPIVLTVSGAVEAAPTAEGWTFDLAALKAMEVETFETTTIWTEGDQTFVGVPLAALQAHVGGAEGTIRAVALNDYAVNIPTSDAVAGSAVVAYMRNGAEMSRRDKGPLWIVYPFDSNSTYRTEEYYSRSIWQLDRLEFVAHD